MWSNLVVPYCFNYRMVKYNYVLNETQGLSQRPVSRSFGQAVSFNSGWVKNSQAVFVDGHFYRYSALTALNTVNIHIL